MTITAKTMFQTSLIIFILCMSISQLFKVDISYLIFPSFIFFMFSAIVLAS